MHLTSCIVLKEGTEFNWRWSKGSIAVMYWIGGRDQV